jgi:hypothetical protein
MNPGFVYNWLRKENLPSKFFINFGSSGHSNQPKD